MNIKFAPISIAILLSLFSIQTVLARTPPPSFSARLVSFNKDNSQLAYLASDRSSTNIVKINIATGKVIKKIPYTTLRRSKPFAATVDGFKFLASSAKGIDVIHNGTGKVLRTLPNPSAVRDWHNQSIQSEEGVLLAVPTISPSVRRIDLVHTGSGKVVHSIDLLKGEKWQRYPRINAIGFNQKRNLIAYEMQAEGKSTLHVYDIYKRAEQFRVAIPFGNNEYGSIEFSKNGKYLTVSAVNRGSLQVVNLQNHTVQDLKYRYASFVNFNRNDQLIILQAHDNLVTVHNIETGQKQVTPLKFFRTFGVYGSEIAQSADRSLIALPYLSQNPENINQFLLLNAQTGKVIRELKNN